MPLECVLSTIFCLNQDRSAPCIAHLMGSAFIQHIVSRSAVAAGGCSPVSCTCCSASCCAAAASSGAVPAQQLGHAAWHIGSSCCSCMYTRSSSGLALLLAGGHQHQLQRPAAGLCQQLKDAVLLHELLQGSAAAQDLRSAAADFAWCCVIMPAACCTESAQQNMQVL